MRIAQVCPYDLTVPGGVQTQVRGLARELRRRGHDVDIVGPGAPGWEWLGPVASVPSNDAIARVAVSPLIRLRLPQALADFDIVHVHEPLMPMVSTAAARTPVPVVGTLHADPSPRIRRLLGAGYGRSVIKRMAVLTAVSPVARSALRLRAVQVIPNAIESELFQPGPKDARSVLFVGRDEPRKGLSVLIDAWEHVQEVLGDARLQVISDRTSGPGAIEWLGPVSDAQRIERMRHAQVVCAPNLRGESFGMIVAEALGAGCSIVASDLPAFRWVAGSHADYVPPGDSQALAGQIVERLSRPHRQLEQRGGAARFRWEEVGERYEAVLAGVRRSC